MNILLVDHNYPKDTPFLLNKYRALGLSNNISLVHWGKVVPNGVIRNRSNGSGSKQLLFGFIILFLTRPLYTLSVIVKGYRSIGKRILKLMIRDNVFFREPVDIIHFEFGTLAVDRMYLKQLLQCKIVVSFRGYDLNYYKLNAEKDVYDEVWQQTDAFHFLGNDLLQRAIKRGYQNNKPNFLISPAIDIDLFTPEEKSKPLDKTIQIVSTGRLVWKKGYQYALLAIRKLIDSGYDIRYTIIGDGPMYTALTFSIHQLGLQNHVHLAGKCTQDQIKNILQKSDIFSHPAVSEGFCNAVIEAQAMQLPVVSTNADGLSENIQDNTTGFIVPIYDAAALVLKLSTLIDNPDMMKSFGKSGRERVLLHFRLEDQIAKIKSMYSEVSNQKATS